ncbi:DUF4265 domain-containing protein [Bacillus sp. FJAT-27264]|uniref:DUF4265 domain-containing protein n=1 Tax=Paenibacillus sp. (strain DSM 101736 / FJAT-27264) TaxID=1850362 RepID=UPI001586A04F|nr:DUF4265 domain-containing protein [Bacillus sp. FJAT-27264]
MPKPLELHICFDERGFEIEVLDVTPVDRDMYRIEETPIFNPGVSMGDVIRLKEERGVYYYQETVRKSDLKRYAWLLTQDTAYSPILAAFKQRVNEAGGSWEQIFGGLVVIHIPQDSVLDVEDEMNRIIECFGE